MKQKEQKIWRLTRGLGVKRAPGLEDSRLPRVANNDEGGSVTLSPGTWLLELGMPPLSDEEDTTADRWYFYRLASGETVLSGRKVTNKDAELITDPQAAVALMNLLPVSEAVWQEDNIHLGRPLFISPFVWLKCPLCGTHSSFASIEFSAVTCTHCLARFEIEPRVVGSPVHTLGWQCTLTSNETMNWEKARILIPPGIKLTLPIDDGWPGQRHPLDMSTDHCDCEPGRPLLTDEEHPVFRPGLHRCNLGPLMQWAMRGRVPYIGEYNSTVLPKWRVGNGWWPHFAAVEVSGIAFEERLAIQAILQDRQQTVGGDSDKYLALLQRWTTLPPYSPYIWPGPHPGQRKYWPGLPELAHLEDDERFILHNWSLSPVNSAGFEYYALPAWVVARPQYSSHEHTKYITGWEVIEEKRVCPICTQPVTSQDLSTYVKVVDSGKEPFEPQPHHGCWEAWKEGNWSVFREALAQAGVGEPPEQQLSLI